MRIIEKSLNRTMRILAKAVNRIVMIRPQKDLVPVEWNMVFDHVEDLRECMGLIMDGDVKNGSVIPERISNVKIRFTARSCHPERDIEKFFKNLDRFQAYTRVNRNTFFSVSGDKVRIRICGVWTGDTFDAFDMMDESTGLVKDTSFTHTCMEISADDRFFSL